MSHNQQLKVHEHCDLMSKFQTYRSCTIYIFTLVWQHACMLIVSTCTQWKCTPSPTSKTSYRGWSWQLIPSVASVSGRPSEYCTSEADPHSIGDSGIGATGDNWMGGVPTIYIGNVSHLLLQVRDGPLHILLDWQVLVVVDEDSWYPMVVQLCVATAPCSLAGL